MSEKRKVTMTNVKLVGQDAKGKDVYQREEATDFVPVEILDAYLEDARTRWGHITVGEEPDHGPGGPNGKTVVPKGLNHELAGKTLVTGKEK